jgi:hypothetical protein
MRMTSMGTVAVSTMLDVNVASNSEEILLVELVEAMLDR